VEAIVTGAGRRIACDFVVAGIGIEPEIPAVAVATENGILADELCRASAPDVYVAGDVANILHPLFGRIRVEHYNNAEKQGAAAARSMLGSTAPYDYLYSFWSDQYEHKIEYVGHVTKWDEFVVRGSLEEGKLIGCYLVDGVVRAASASTAAVIPNWTSTARWRHAPAWCPREPGRLRPCSPTTAPTYGRWPGAEVPS